MKSEKPHRSVDGEIAPSTATSKGSQVFLADADGNNVKLMVSETPS